MKKSKRAAAAALSALLVFGTAVPALASETAAPAVEDTEASQKEEVVYATLGSDGSLVSAYVVNSFPGGEISDYGDYSSVRILNTDDEIDYSRKQVNITSDAVKVYYQGELAHPVLPWNFTLEYSLDGREMSAQEIAGQTGDVEIRLAVTKNEDCDGSFYDDYALQISFTLSGDVFSGISAKDATIASVGADKQLTYTLLPGEGIDTSITAHAENFALGEVSINGIHLNLNVDVDTQDIKAQVSELVDATSRLSSGAGELLGGSEELRDGASGLLSGSEELQSGIAELDEGVQALSDGLSVMGDGLDELYANSSSLVSGSRQVYSALEYIDSQLSSMSVSTDALASMIASAEAIGTAAQGVLAAVEPLQSQLENAGQLMAMAEDIVTEAQQANANALTELGTVTSEEPNVQSAIATAKTAIETSDQCISLIYGGAAAIFENVSNGAAALTASLQQLLTSCETFQSEALAAQEYVEAMLAQLDELKAGISTLADEYGALDDGIGAYTGGVAQLVDGFGSVMNGVAQLASGSASLLEGSGELTGGASELYNGVAELCTGAESMANGASALNSETSSLDVQEQIDTLLEDIGGNMDSPESFVDERNGTVSSVQFVIRTTAIDPPAEPAEPGPAEEPQSFWDRLLALFGL